MDWSLCLAMTLLVVAATVDRPRRAIPLLVAGIGVAVVADGHRLLGRIEGAPLLERWAAWMDIPGVAVVSHALAAVLILWGMVRLVKGGDPQLAMARRLERRGDHRGAADIYHRAGRLPKALKLYTSSHCWAQAAEVARRLNKTTEAAKHFRRAGGRHLAEAGRLYRQSGDTETAVRCDRELAQWLMDDGHFDEAVEAWLRANDPQRAVRAATHALQQRRLSTSGGAFRAARRAAEEMRDHRTLALLSEAEGDWSAAAHAWRRAGDHGRAAECFRKIGHLTEALQAEEAAGRPRQAAELRVQRLRRAQEKLRLHETRGEASRPEVVALSRQVAVETEALVSVLGRLEMRDEMIAILRDSGRSEEAVHRLVEEGQKASAAEIARGAQRWDLAAPLLEELERWGEASDVHELAGDIEAAAQCAERAGEYERALHFYRNLGRPADIATCLARMGFLEEALVELHRAALPDVALDLLKNHPGPVPDIPDVVLDMARWAEDYASTSDAIAVLQRAVIGVALQPDRLEPAIALGEALLKVGDLEAAEAQVDRVLTCDYSYAPARRLREKVLQARSARDAAPTQPAEVTSRAPAISEAQQRYEIRTELGRGGMGVVYHARDTRLERDVAIKVLRTTSAEEAARLEQEARAAATLNHPGIVTVYDFEVGFDGYFIAMEYVPGEALDQLLKTQPDRVRGMLQHVLVRLAEAIGYAHSRQVIHRDLKPGNILVTPDGDVKILDFGIAARLDLTTAGGSGGVCGTPFYMAPEQIRGEVPTPATDVYAFGATAFHLATGRPPFARGNVIDAHLKQPPPHPTEIVPDVDPGLADVILRCLAKEPADRYQSANELRQALVAVHDRV